MTETNHLDENIRHLMGQAPAPAGWREGAPERVFQATMARLRGRDEAAGDGQERELGAGRQRAITRLWPALAAAALLLLLALPWLRHPNSPPRGGTPAGGQATNTPAVTAAAALKVYRPAAGAGLTVQLDDGSSLVVAGGAEVRVRTEPQAARPRVHLERGSVTCSVAKGPGRFKVTTPVGAVTALGTVFKVELSQAAQGERLEENLMTSTGRNIAGKETGAGKAGKTIHALVMAVTVMAGEVLVSDAGGAQQLVLKGERVQVGKGPIAKVVENWRSGQLVPKLEDGSRGKPLEVRRHRVRVTIKEQVAHVEVEETFYNPQDRRLEGTFFFPLPHGATLCRLAMYVGDNLMEGEIAESQRARRTFEALKVQRVDPALLEWAGGNNFKMRVFPIEPRSEKRVIIGYYQVLKREHGKVRFTYPLVADSLQTLPVGEIDIKVEANSTPPILRARTPGYDARLDSSPQHLVASCNLRKAKPQRDFTLEYEVDGKDQEVAVAPYWHAKDNEGYFLMLFAPPLEEYRSGKEVGSRFVFVLDKSGGQGQRWLNLGVRALLTALEQLDDHDEFGIVAYDTLAATFKSKLMAATPQNVRAARAWLQGLRAFGASDIQGAWKAAAALAGPAQATLVYTGSGMSTLTSTRSARLLAAARKALADTHVRIHTLPLGPVTDTGFLASLAHAFDGTCRPVRDAEDAEEQVNELMDDYCWPLYRNLKVDFQWVDVYATYPVTLPNVTAGRQFLLLGKYRGPGKAKVRVSAVCDGKEFAKEYEVELGKKSKNAFVPRLWAARKIGYLQDQAALAPAQEAGDLRRTIIETSKRFRVMSHYTSFIVLESAEDYLRYGIERRRDEFAQGNAAADKKSATGLQEVENSASARRRGGGELKEGAARRATYGAPTDGLALRTRGAVAGAPPPAPTLADKAAVGARRKRAVKSDEDVDTMAWARTKIFPTFAANRLPAWPRKWPHGEQGALNALREVSSKLHMLSITLKTFSQDRAGKEKQQGRDWEVVLDARAGAYSSRRPGADNWQICNGKQRVHFFPLLKYACKRTAGAEDLAALGNSLPGLLLPWVEKLDRDWLVKVQRRQGELLVLRLQARHNQRTYKLVYLDTRRKVVTRVEDYRARWSRPRGWESYLAQTVHCETIKDFGGVFLPTLIRVTRPQADKQPAAIPVLRKLKVLAGGVRKEVRVAESHAVVKAANEQETADQVVRIVRLTGIEVNAEIEPKTFATDIPADWSTRDLDLEPRGRERQRISSPWSPSRGTVFRRRATL